MEGELAVLALGACNKDNQTSGGGDAPASTVQITQASPPPGGTWADVTNATSAGGFMMGDPNAKVKLVEYMSLTCPHCKDFEEHGFPKLRDQYVKKGTVSLEVRNYVRDPIDMTASLVTRCGGPDPYFAMTEQTFAQQADIFDKMQKLPQDQIAKLQTQPPAAQFKALAALLGIDTFAKQRGIPQEKLDACFNDQAAVDKLVAMQKKANDQQIPGTPAFFLNGELLQSVGTWDQLEPKLKEAGA